MNICVKWKNRRDQDGFSLLETMVALVILSIGILALARLQWASVGNNAAALRSTEAIFAAQSQIEIFERTAYSDINNDGAGEGGYTAITNDNNEIIPEGFVLKWRVIQELDLSDPGDGVNDLMEIRIRVEDSFGKIRADVRFCKIRGV